MAQPIALLSVSDKRGLVPLAAALVELGYAILSTGGTAKALREAGIEVIDVSTHTGFPEMMGGRLKTLHPKVHGGILGLRGTHDAVAAEHGIAWIDIVVVNLYPFEATIAKDGVTFEEAVEQIDIGGPTMVRSAAKNHRDVLVVTNPDDYDGLVEALRQGTVSDVTRREFALKAFRHTSYYDAVIAQWLADQIHAEGEFVPEVTLPLRLVQQTRYGENPHQDCAFYREGGPPRGRSLARAVQHHGKEMSANNWRDLDAAVHVAFSHKEPTCAIIKHMNPCGCATAPDLATAYARALAGDPTSAFGGIVAFNRLLALEDVIAVRQSKVFYEVLVAPGFAPDALERLRGKSEDLRIVELPTDWANDDRPGGFDISRIQGGYLVQDWDFDYSFGPVATTDRKPTQEEQRALWFAWRTCRHVKSNAIVLARALPDGEVLNGVGAGQMNRKESVRLAIGNATLPVPGSVLASDAFFPFPDGPLAAAEAGVTAIIQPGGSKKDEEVIAVANAHDIAMIFTGVRHFRH